MNKFFNFSLITLCSIFVIGCNNNPEKKEDINVTIKTDIFNIHTSLNKDSITNKYDLSVKVNESNTSNYLVYLVDKKTNDVIATKYGKANQNIVFNELEVDVDLYASRSFDYSFTKIKSEPKKINDLYPNFYEQTYIDSVNSEIEELKSKSAYNINNPLIIDNPFGTDALSTYFYFNTNEETKIQYRIVTKNHKIFERNILNDYQGNEIFSLKHEFSTHGVIEKETNYIVLNEYNTKNKLTSTFYISKEGPTLSEIDSKWSDLSIKKETFCDKPMCDGLYAFNLGQEKMSLNRSTSLALMDNECDVRYFIPMNDGFFQNIKYLKYKEETCILYLIDYHQFALVNYLGQVKKIIELKIDEGSPFSNGGSITFSHFFSHHDFTLDDNGNLLILAGRTTQYQLDKHEGSMAEVTPGKYGKYVIRYNLSGEASKIDTIDVILDIFDTILPGYSSFTSKPVDWFHPNTIQYLKENDSENLIISSRETSLIAKVKLGSILTSPEGPKDAETLWRITENNNVLNYQKDDKYLTKTGTKCLPILGQHSSYIIKDNIYPDRKLSENQYYLSVFSNNTKANNSGNTWDFEVSTETIGKKSLCNIYLVDEVQKTYSLVQQIEVYFGEWMSNFNYLPNTNWLSASSSHMTFEEFSTSGEKISKITFVSNDPEKTGLDSIGYRGFKFNI